VLEFFIKLANLFTRGKFLGGTTYIAIASLALASSIICESQRLSPAQRELTIQWLLGNQDHSGGFRGRTGKDADACYCFWCAGALKVSSTFKKV
jgi:geranylgeranyl transferase type-1 subunit beta